MNKNKISHIMLATLFSVAGLYADDFGDSFDSSASNNGITFSGFAELEQGANITGAGPLRDGSNQTQKEWIMANRRFRLKTDKSLENGSFYSSLDFIRDEVNNQSYIDIRELRLQYKLSSWLDMSVGRQVSTWGVADMLFINDLFPKNWVSNFTGRDMESMKDSSDSLRLTSYFGETTVDLVYHPKFAPDTTPNGCTLSVFDPNSNSLISNQSGCQGASIPSNQTNRFDDGELATQVKHTFNGHDLALYGYHGFFKNPKGLEMVGSMLMPYYPRLNVYGASYEGPVAGGILSFETGYYDSLDDQDGDQMLIENSSLKYLLGYRYDLTSWLSVGIQGMRETMMKYDEYSDSMFNDPYRLKENRHTATLRVTVKTMQETLWFNLFSYVRPDDKDSFTKFDVTKQLSSVVSVVAGLNVFTGKNNYRNREFGMLDYEDNIFARIKYNF